MEYTESEYDEIEYHPLDGVLAQATDALLAIAKNNVAALVAQLKWENTHVKNENTRLSTELARAQAKVRELANREAELDGMAAKMPIEKFFGQRAVIMYKPSYSKLYRREKCGKCNADRQIEYVTPLGKQAFEICDCDAWIWGYKPEERVLTELRKDSSRALLMWFKPYEYRDTGGYSSNDFVEDKEVYQPSSNFAELDKYKAYFRDLDDCQVYCDWLNGNVHP